MSFISLYKMNKFGKNIKKKHSFKKITFIFIHFMFINFIHYSYTSTIIKRTKSILFS